MQANNLIIPAEQATTPFFQNRRNMQLKYIGEISNKFPAATLLQVPLFDREIKGIDVLNQVAGQIFNQGGKENE